jgi:uncharacterized protein (TIGR02271 family)
MRVRGPDGFDATVADADARHTVVSHGGRTFVLPTSLLVRTAPSLFEIASDPDEGAARLVVPVVEETLDVDRRQVTTGRVRISKHVTREEVVVDEPVLRDRVDVERRAVNRIVAQAPGVRQDGDVTIVPILEEVLVIEKRLMLREELHIRRTHTTAHEPQRHSLRREHARVERIDEPSPPGDAPGGRIRNPQHERQESSMDRTLVAVFDSPEQARQAAQQLAGIGIPEERVHTRSGSTADLHAGSDDAPAYSTDGDSARRGGFFARLFGLDDDLETAGQYEEAARRGSVVVAIDPLPEELVDDASRILSQNGAIDMDERVTQWRERGWTGYDHAAPAMTDEELTRERELAAPRVPQPESQSSDEHVRIPVVEERLEVGKRRVERGAVRVFTRIAERPVEEQVELRQERARIERRAVDREATEADLGAAFQEGSLEIRESEEQPVVAKRARVVEEVDIGKEVSERTETVRDTVRRSEVDVEDVPASRPNDVPRGDGARRR